MNNLLSGSANFTVKKVSLKGAIKILAKNRVEVNEDEAAIILDFLYHIAQSYYKHDAHKKMSNLKGKSNLSKT
jgi:hypothetical protein